MLTATRLAETLGGRRILPRVADYETLAERVREGLPYAALEAVAARYGVPLRELVGVLDLPERTLARRKREGRLRADESDRLLRLCRIAALAEDVLGDVDKAARWLRRANRALGRRAPLECLGTDLGARQVETALQRLAHGVFS